MTITTNVCVNTKKMRMISYFSKNNNKLLNSNGDECEDCLTSTVLDLLKYLPNQVFLRILSKSLYHSTLKNIESQIIESIDFWPKWSAEFPMYIKDDLPPKNERFVEPDVFIRLTDYDIIIEAKRWNKKQQDINQIKRERLAYKKEYDEENRNVILIQLGGLIDKNIKKEYNGVPIYKTD